MNRLAVIIPYFKRPELTRICFENISKQSKRLGFDVFVSGDNKDLADEFDFNFVESKNNPVAQKNNKLIQACKDYDGVVLVGSDNFISDSIFELYQNIDLTEPKMYGFDNLHFYSTKSRKLVTDGVYGKGISIGVGRLFTKSLLESIKYKAWTGVANKGLDTNCSKNINKKGFEEVILDYGNHLILDVKHEGNITSHKIIDSCVTDCDIDLISDYKKILSLNKSDKPEQLKIKKVKKAKSEKVRVSIIFPIEGLKVEQKCLVRKTTATALINRGIAKYE